MGGLDRKPGGSSVVQKPGGGATGPTAIGKQTLVDQLSSSLPPIQRKAAATGASVDDPHAAAQHGVAGASGALPFAEQIQRSFGRHDISPVRAQIGGAGMEANEQLGAHAYAYGERIAFAAPPDLHTAAHEAAHVVQQRSGVSVPGGVGAAGDSHERQADAVADAVVAGRSAEAMLGDGGAVTSASPAIQRKTEPEPFVATSADKDGSMLGGQVQGVTAQEWMWTWGPKLNESLSGYLETTAFDLPTTFGVWNSGSSSAFAKAM